MTNYEKEIAAQEELIARRKGALARKRDREKESPGEKASGAQTAGILSERELRQLVKQAQRRKAKLAKDRARRAGARATADER